MRCVHAALWRGDGSGSDAHLTTLPCVSQALLPKKSEQCCSKRRLRILVSDFVFWQIRVGIWLMGLLLGYEDFDPAPDSLALCCHTNGMGHVIQMLRIIDVLNAGA